MKLKKLSKEDVIRVVQNAEALNMKSVIVSKFFGGRKNIYQKVRLGSEVGWIQFSGKTDLIINQLLTDKEVQMTILNDYGGEAEIYASTTYDKSPVIIKAGNLEFENILLNGRKTIVSKPKRKTAVKRH